MDADAADAEEGEEDGAGEEHAESVTAKSPKGWELGTDGRGYGRRVREDDVGARRVTGKKRGRPLKDWDSSSKTVRTVRASRPRKLLWTDTSREEYSCVLACETCGGAGTSGVGQRFERGEGSGVT